MTIWSVLCPSSSATLRRSTPTITSLLAKVWLLQCQVYPSIFASSSALGNQPRDPWRDSPVRMEGKTGVGLIFLALPSRSLRAVSAIEFRGMVRGSPFLVLGRWICRRSKSTWPQSRGPTSISGWPVFRPGEANAFVNTGRLIDT